MFRQRSLASISTLVLILLASIIPAKAAEHTELDPAHIDKLTQFWEIHGVPNNTQKFLINKIESGKLTDAD
ncbi:hypothetical protein RQN30_09370 [Arcanobacterium hippocoleae]